MYKQESNVSGHLAVHSSEVLTSTASNSFKVNSAEQDCHNIDSVSDKLPELGQDVTSVLDNNSTKPEGSPGKQPSKRVCFKEETLGTETAFRKENKENKRIRPTLLQGYGTHAYEKIVGWRGRI